MKFVFGLALILMVFEAATLGSILMNHGMVGVHPACLAASVTGSSSCLESNILPGFIAGTLIITLLLLLLAVLYILLEGTAPSGELIGRINETETFFNSSSAGLLKYLTFHENSPSFA